MNSTLPFIEKSNVSDCFLALMIDDASTIKHAAEFILFHSLLKLELDPVIYALPLDSQEPIAINEFG